MLFKGLNQELLIKGGRNVCVCVWGGWSIGKIHNDGVV